MASTAKDLAKRLISAVADVAALSEAELQEERSSEEEGEEVSVLRLALLRVLAMLHASAAPAEEPGTLKSIQKLLAVRALSSCTSHVVIEMNKRQQNACAVTGTAESAGHAPCFSCACRSSQHPE